MSGFKLRSGNGPLQFKEMGATPAKGIFADVGDWLSGDSKKSSSEIASVADVKKFQTQKKDFKTTRKDFKEGNKQEIEELKISGASKKEIKQAKKINRAEERDLKRSHKKDLREIDPKPGTWVGRNIKKAGQWLGEKGKQFDEFRTSEKGKEIGEALERASVVLDEDSTTADVLAKNKEIRNRGKERKSIDIDDAYKVAKTRNLNRLNAHDVAAWQNLDAKENDLTKTNKKAVDEEGNPVFGTDINQYPG